MGKRNDMIARISNFKLQDTKTGNINNHLEWTYVEIIVHIEIEGNKMTRKVGAYN